MSGSIVCVGDVMVDVLARLPGPLALGSDTPAQVRVVPGGSAANTACWLAWLSVPVLFAGRVGNDSAGRDAVAVLQAAGVRTRVAVDPTLPTGVCIVLVGPDGERTMIPSAGANGALAAADLDGLLGATDHLHLSGYSLLNERSRPAALAVLEQARTVGAGISVDAASAAPIRTVGGQAVLDWLPAGTLLIANAAELAALTEHTGPAEHADPAEHAGLAALLARGLSVVVKEGPAGAWIAGERGLHRVATTPVPVLDSTGAGDAFAAGLLAAIREDAIRNGAGDAAGPNAAGPNAAGRDGAGLADAVRHGNQVAAQALGTLGGRPRGASE